MAVGLIVLLLGVGLVTAGTGSAGAAESDESRLDEMHGDGTEENPYVIRDAEDLQAMQENTSAHYVLGTTIDAEETSTWEGGAGFEPIGSEDEPFTGTLDGRNHRITGLSIDRPGTEQVGLIGYTYEGTVENVVLEEASIKGGQQVGGVVGYNRGTIEDVIVSGTVQSTEETLGGLVGLNGGTIRDSSVRGTVEGTDDNVGGLVGVNSGSVDSSYAETEVRGAEIVGGLVGSNRGPVRASFAAGSVRGEEVVGGLMGANGDAVNDAYAVATANATESVGGLFGSNDGTVASSYAAGSVDGDRAAGGLAGSNDGIIEHAYWNVNTTGQRDAHSEADEESDEDIVGLSPAEITGENVTETTELDFENTWNATETYPRLQWESDRYVPSSAHDVPVDGELPPKAPESEDSESSGGTDFDTEREDDASTNPLPSPGFGAVTALVAVLLTAAVARRR